MPVPQTLTASRNATWAPTLVYPYQGPALPLDGAHIAMQIRLYGGALGDALLTLPAIAFTDTLASGTAGQSDELRWLSLSPRVEPGDPANAAAATWAAMPASGEAGDSRSDDFDIRITYADGASELLVSPGVFILAPGVTTV
ncbi:hypothetical protein [Sphingomonas bacterium]|uniref:hypothetical protein n=1 Tax=Sphingomonas bacterium TaxID=1895847 RepID=UPI0015769979|nr:hypothetical protein [Sphingomonas bacterium]